jgi:glutathione S-transferase
VQRAVISLTEKQVPFDQVYVDLSNKPDWFKDISPLGKVPPLRVTQPAGTDAVLFESNVICEYIEDTQAGPSLHPADPLKRAQHRAWMEFGSAILGDIFGLENALERETFEAKRIALSAKFARLESALGPGLYFDGSEFSLVDAVFGDSATSIRICDGDSF